MKKSPTFVLLVIAISAAAACGQKAPPTNSQPGTVTAQSPAQSDVEDPKTGTNTGRPDSPKDLKPGTDGNTQPNAPAP
jgi:hypothetical protein